MLCYEETKDLLKQKRQRKEKEMKEIEQVKIDLEQEEEDEQYVHNLEKKLDIIHTQLIKVCVARRTRKY